MKLRSSLTAVSVLSVVEGQPVKPVATTKRTNYEDFLLRFTVFPVYPGR